jgi:hypothetical protein
LRWVTVQPVTLKDAPDARWRPGTLAGVFGRLPRLGALAEVRTGLRAGFGGAFGAGAGLRTRLRLLAAALRAAGVPTLMAPVVRITAAAFVGVVLLVGIAGKNLDVPFGLQQRIFRHRDVGNIGAGP